MVVAGHGWAEDIKARGMMSMDCTTMGYDRTECAPLVETFAEDDLAARRIESVLLADGMDVAARGRMADTFVADSTVDPDVVVVTCGRGITQRDAQIRRLRKRLPDTHVIAVIPEDSRRGVRRALEAGADGVVFEATIEDVLPATVRAVLAGQTAVPAAGRHEVDRPTLSGREKQVLGMVVAGLSNKAIAGELYLAESTVKCHLSSAFSKLGVRSRNEAADLILQSGIQFGPAVTARPMYATTEGSEL
jgi:DNA-binding NarL/FixJ family response regulator